MSKSKSTNETASAVDIRITKLMSIMFIANHHLSCHICIINHPPRNG